MHTEREQLWIAMSDLWLDTELSDERLMEIAVVVRESGLGKRELNQVFEGELAPFLGQNHQSVAGEWSGFDPAWVCQQAAANREKSGMLGRTFDRALGKLGVTTFAARQAWQGVLGLAFANDADG